MDRSIAEIRAELAIVNVRLNMVIEENDVINARGERLSKRRKKLIKELGEAQNV